MPNPEHSSQTKKVDDESKKAHETTIKTSNPWPDWLIILLSILGIILLLGGVYKGYKSFY